MLKRWYQEARIDLGVSQAVFVGGKHVGQLVKAFVPNAQLGQAECNVSPLLHVLHGS